MTDEKDLHMEIENETVQDDEEIIELTDIVQMPPVESKEEMFADDISEPAPGEDQDQVTTEGVETAGELKEIEEIGAVIDELDEVSEDETSDVDEAIEEEMDTVSDTEDDFVDSLGMELEPEEEEGEDFPETREVDPKEVEDALERVIRKMFYEKIDSILVEAIEKTVTQEIERIKKALSEEM